MEVADGKMVGEGRAVVSARHETTSRHTMMNDMTNLYGSTLFPDPFDDSSFSLTNADA